MPSLPDKSHPTPPNLYSHHVSTPSTVASMDSTATDFKAFYPYTPNEVKHRKRTTNAQLKILESIFKRNTKPNASLRVDLAAQLGMTPRGVQVWFQNRRAKEKLKETKTRKVGVKSSGNKESGDEEPGSVSPVSAHPSSELGDTHHPLDSPPRTSSPGGASPQIPHIYVQDQYQSSWAIPSDNPYFSLDPNLHRRGSLPVNALPHHRFSSQCLPDAFDPSMRRLSVDASLQRLANNPYAHLARAKNTGLFGPQAIAPVRRSPSRPGHFALQNSASIPYPSDVRRASINAFPSGTVSPSLSSLSPHYAIRSSLPENQLYATSRTLSSPLPGPLPAPNFSFGAANTSSMVSARSGGSEGDSPDSLQAFEWREVEQDDEDGNLPPASYYPQSRFGSIASVATSDSSLNSTGYPEVLPYFPDSEYNLSVRRDSCVSGPFASLMSNLDVSGIHDSMRDPEEHEKCAILEDVGASGVIRVNSGDIRGPAGPYPPPTSAISPELLGAHHSLTNGTSSIPISKSSELAFALRSHSDQVNALLASPSIVPPVNDADSTDQYSFSQSIGQQVVPTQESTASTVYDDRYSFDLGQSGSYLPENHGDNSLNQTFDATNVAYRPTMGSLEPMTHNFYATYARGSPSF